MFNGKICTDVAVCLGVTFVDDQLQPNKPAVNFTYIIYSIQLISN